MRKAREKRAKGGRGGRKVLRVPARYPPWPLHLLAPGGQRVLARVFPRALSYVAWRSGDAGPGRGKGGEREKPRDLIFCRPRASPSLSSHYYLSA